MRSIEMLAVAEIPIQSFAYTEQRIERTKLRGGWISTLVQKVIYRNKLHLKYYCRELQIREWLLESQRL